MDTDRPRCLHAGLCRWRKCLGWHCDRFSRLRVSHALYSNRDAHGGLHRHDWSQSDGRDPLNLHSEAPSSSRAQALGATGRLLGLNVVADRSRTEWFGVLPSQRVVAIVQD